MAKRKAIEMLSSPATEFDISSTDPPVSKGMGFLATQSGERLETMTRATRPIVTGIMAAEAYCARYESSYIQGKKERIMRLAVASGGEGRREMIAMVSAGGQMSDAFYDQGEGRQMDYEVGGDERCRWDPEV